MTRAEAIEILDSIARRNVFCTLEEKPLEAFWMATEALREQEQREWISVKERLPEDERNVLAYYGFGRDGIIDSDMRFMGALCYYCFDPKPHWQHAMSGVIVTHWMPLPEPPKED